LCIFRRLKNISLLEHDFFSKYVNSLSFKRNKQDKTDMPTINMAWLSNSQLFSDIHQ